jgi:FkbM family methyltransferase
MDNAFAKLTSHKWLREAIGGRIRDLVNTVGFKPEVIEREVVGEKYRFYLGNVTGKSWYGSKVDNSYEMAFVKNHLIASGDVVIECGAHHGAQTILLSRWVGNTGKVIAVEPIPENVAILRTNIELNGLENVVVVPEAAGAQCGYVSMRPYSNGSVAYNQNTDTIRMKCITLDKVAADLNVKPTFLKIDVEGYEYQILEGSKNLLATTPAVFVEVHTLSLARYGKTFADLWKLINPNLYNVYSQSEDDELPKTYSWHDRPGERVHLFFQPRN